jgi:putative ABC transport system permease protein
VINEAAALKLGFASAHDAAGKYILDGSGRGTPMQVVGVAPDIRHRSAREAMQPTVYFLTDETSVFTVKAREIEAVRREIETMWARFFPNDVLDVKRVGGLFALNYADDLRLAKLLAASSVIAIAAFGISPNARRSACGPWAPRWPWRWRWRWPPPCATPWPRCGLRRCWRCAIKLGGQACRD